MTELKTHERALTAVDLATFGIPPQPADGPQLVKGPVSEKLGREATVAEPVPLFPESEMGVFRSQWSTLQAGFVDDPRRVVKDADRLVAAVMQRIAESFSSDRSELEKQWDRGDSVSTEDLRVALQQYRSFFERLLTL